MRRADFLERPWCWERSKTKGEEGSRVWDGKIASLNQWTWIWANSGRWWRTEEPGVIQSMGSQRVGYDLVTERQLLSQPVTHNATASRWMKEIWTGICFYVWKPISCSVLYFTRERNLKILLSSFHMMFPHSETYIDLMGYFISSLKTIFTSLPDWNVHLIPMRVTFFVFFWKKC